MYVCIYTCTLTDGTFQCMLHMRITSPHIHENFHLHYCNESFEHMLTVGKVGGQLLLHEF